MKPMKHLLAAAALAAAVAMSATVPAQAEQPQADMAQMHQRLASFRHVPLTVEKARAAIEIFLTLRQKYPPSTFRNETPGPMGAVEAMKRSEKAREILDMISARGFADIDEWARTFASVGMALAHVREGEQAVQKKLKELDEAPMPQQIKARIRAMLEAIIPPRQNVQVARQLLDDEQTRKMIAAVEKSR